eukprot:1141132-Pelagomonas_calceolata.AAC.1
MSSFQVACLTLKVWALLQKANPGHTRTMCLGRTYGDYGSRMIELSPVSKMLRFEVHHNLKPAQTQRVAGMRDS